MELSVQKNILLLAKQILKIKSSCKIMYATPSVIETETRRLLYAPHEETGGDIVIIINGVINSNTIMLSDPEIQ